MSGACLKIPSEWAKIVRGNTGAAEPNAASSFSDTTGAPGGSQKPKRDRAGNALQSPKRPPPSPAHSTSAPPTSGRPKSHSSGGGAAREASCAAADRHHHTGDSVIDACNNILGAIARQHSRRGSGGGDAGGDEQQQQQPLNMECILSRLPYKDMLRDFFSDRGVVAPSVPIITRAYEESYMREPIDSSERPCVMGDQCECMLLSRDGTGFVGVEFLLPNERPGPTPQSCVLCHRKLVQTLFHEIIFAGSPYRGVIQRYGNICGHPGEYAREVMLICPPNGPCECMPYPSVSHQRNRYRVVVRNGVSYAQQLHVSPQDFGQPPPA